MVPAFRTREVSTHSSGAYSLPGPGVTLRHGSRTLVMVGDDTTVVPSYYLVYDDVQVNDEASLYEQLYIGDADVIVREHGADIGFGQDADGDRLSVVSEEGIAIGEEYTLAFAAEVMAERDCPGPLVTNLSTSRMIDEVAARHGREVLRAKVGEVNVVETMIAEGAVGGGEGNGGVIDPTLRFCRDNLAAMALILQGMAWRGCTISEWAGSFAPSAIMKEKLECPAGRTQRAILALIRHYEGQRLDLTEGVKVLSEDGSWMHARPSNTEPILRVIAEADDCESARRLCDEALAVARQAIG